MVLSHVGQEPEERYLPTGHEVHNAETSQVEQLALQAKVQVVAAPLHLAHTVLLHGLQVPELKYYPSAQVKHVPVVPQVAQSELQAFTHAVALPLHVPHILLLQL